MTALDTARAALEEAATVAEIAQQRWHAAKDQREAAVAEMVRAWREERGNWTAAAETASRAIAAAEDAAEAYWSAVRAQQRAEEERDAAVEAAGLCHWCRAPVELGGRGVGRWSYCEACGIDKLAEVGE